MNKNNGFTPIKNGLWEGIHRKKMGEAIWLFGKYIQFAKKYIDNTESSAEVCVRIYPKSIQTALDINKETWFDWHTLLEREGYISSKYLADSGYYAVCIYKPFLFKKI